MIILVKHGGDGYVRDGEGSFHEYLCDSASDVDNLPDGKSFDIKLNPIEARPRPGSRATISDGGAVYVLSPSRSWQCVDAGIVEETSVEETSVEETSVEETTEETEPAEET